MVMRMVALALAASLGWISYVHAAHAAPSIEVYGRLPGFEQAAISPSGDLIAIVGAAKGVRRLLVTNNEREVIFDAPVGTKKIRSIHWAGDSTILLRVTETVQLGIGFTAEAAEFAVMLVVPIDGGKMWSVFENSRTITGGIRGFYGVRKRDDRWFGYFGGITLESSGPGEPYLESTSPDLYEVDLQTHKFRRVARHLSGEDSYRTWLLGSDGNIAATLDFRTHAGNWQIKNGQGKAIASGVSPTGGVGFISLGRAADTIRYTRTNPDSGGTEWFELSLSSGDPQPILVDRYVSDTFVDARNSKPLGHLIEGDVPTPEFYDPRHNKVFAATRKAFPDVNVSLIDWNDSFDRLIVKTDGVGDSGTWWRVDIKTGNADILGASYPMAAADVGPMKIVRYKAADGLDIAGILTLPPKRAPKGLPVVVLPHGGPASRDYLTFNWWAQAFAARGYAVLQPNFRGSTGYGRAFEEAGHGQWGTKMQTDISDGLKELSRQGIVDPARACIMGASYGGYAALAGVTLQQGLYRCAVSVAGISDVQKMYATEVSESGSNNTLIRALKKEIGSGRDLKAISPINFADRADAPILLIHGKNDTVVLHEQSAAMERALRKSGKPVELLTLVGEDHWLSLAETRLSMLQTAVAFVEKHNPPDIVDVSPVGVAIR
jgi:dienelactone hydrolase